jgi:predicted nucleic acid-binding protein
MTTSRAVLDTNVVLDWLVFRNPGVAPLGEAVASGRLRWIGCPAMGAELRHVLTLGALAHRSELVEYALTFFDRFCSCEPLPTALPLTRLRCSDPSDQMFVDLALAQGADWLFSRDRALLKLARKAAPLGLRIRPPEAWAPDAT